MSRQTTRVIFLIGCGVAVRAPLLYIASGAHIHIDWTSKSITGGNPVVLALAQITDVAANSLVAIAYIGALVKLIRLRRWGWVVAMLMTVVVALIVYLIRGPQHLPMAGSDHQHFAKPLDG